MISYGSILVNEYCQIALLKIYIEIKPSKMDGNGNQWQQNNDARIEAIKQQIATLNRQLSSTNLR